MRVVRAALKRVGEGNLNGSLVVVGGTELGELQRGYNSMVTGLRERELVRDLFGRHVGREVAAAAEQQSSHCSTGTSPSSSTKSTVTTGWSTSSRGTLALRCSASPITLTALEIKRWLPRAPSPIGCVPELPECETITLRGHDEPTQLALPV